MLNTFSGIGRLGNDPHVIKKDDGLMVTTFDLAINEFYRKDNELQKKTHWIPCVTFGRMAEIASEFLRKGSQVGVRGQLKFDEWRSESGSQKKALRVHAAELEFLSSRPEPENGTTNE